jgi:hypothetical protein
MLGAEIEQLTVMSAHGDRRPSLLLDPVVGLRRPVDDADGGGDHVSAVTSPRLRPEAS